LTYLAISANIAYMKQMLIRHVPDQLHKELKVLAAQESTTINDLVIRFIQEGIARSIGAKQCQG